MSMLRLTTTVAAALLLAAASAAPAQYRRERRDRYNRDGGRSDREMSTSQAAASSQPADGAGATTRPGGRMEDQYAILTQRSIFARSGFAANNRPPETSRTTTAPVLSPEQAVVFVGVIAQDDEFVAFAENQTTHQLMVLRAGDDVAHGKVVAITLDTLAYGSAGAIKEVHMGQNLAGEVVSGDLLGGSTGGGSSSSTSASAPATAGMTPEQAAVIERLRKRRESGQ